MQTIKVKSSFSFIFFSVSLWGFFFHKIRKKEVNIEIHVNAINFFLSAQTFGRFIIFNNQQSMLKVLFCFCFFLFVIHLIRANKDGLFIGKTLEST